MVLKLSQARLYHISGTEEKRQKYLFQKKFQLLKIFILSEKCLSVAKRVLQGENCSKFETFKFVLDMVLKLSQTKLYHISVQEKRQKHLV